MKYKGHHITGSRPGDFFRSMHHQDPFGPLIIRLDSFSKQIHNIDSLYPKVSVNGYGSSERSQFRHKIAREW